MSRSLPGHSSRRPWLPTETRATPSSAGSSSASHSSMSAAYARLKALPRDDGSRSSASSLGLERVPTSFSGPDPHDGLDGHDPDLAVSDLAGPRRSGNGRSHLLGVGVVDEHLDSNLRHVVHLVLRASVHLGVPTLTAVASNLGDGHPRDLECPQRLGDFVELEGFDDCDHEFHGLSSQAGSDPSVAPDGVFPPPASSSVVIPVWVSARRTKSG